MQLPLSDLQRAALHLAFGDGFGPQARTALAPVASDAVAIMHVDPVQAEARLKPKQLGAWQRARDAFLGRRDDILQGTEKLMRAGAQLLVHGTPEYPAHLHDVADAPLVLMAAGKALEALAGPCVAIVGSRRASPYGLQVARLLGRTLGNAGITVLSGGAQGIDTAAHEGSLEVGGRTVAVLGTVLGERDETHRLRGRMIARGGSITEMLPGMDQHAGSFPQRNRLISGLADAVVIVEGAAESGTRHTAEAAQKQRRRLFAVPGPMFSPGSHTPHDLIRTRAASILVDPADILRAVGVAGVVESMEGSAAWEGASRVVENGGARAAEVPAESVEEHLRPLWRVLGNQALLVDQVADAAGVPVSDAARGLLELELAGMARRQAGGAYLRA